MKAIISLLVLSFILGTNVKAQKTKTKDRYYTKNGERVEGILWLVIAAGFGSKDVRKQRGFYALAYKQKSM